MKIGIVSEFKRNTLNYGNHLQAYALNRFVGKFPSVDCVDSLVMGDHLLNHYTRIFSLRAMRAVYYTLHNELKRLQPNRVKEYPQFSERFKAFEAFRNKYISSPPNPIEGNEICQTDYDVMIVGSDVVWEQQRVKVCRTKFLAFSAQKEFQRIAYAASFGRDYIPEENTACIRKYLQRFDAISVREHSSVSMLNNIGVKNVSYCLDPTLLLTKEEWEALEEKPEHMSLGQPYVFAYLLGEDAQQRQKIMRLAAENSWKVATVPFANGSPFNEDEQFGDIQLFGCSIENWLWLIHHAEYVFTDSFHGVVFSTIFQKRFIALKRPGKVDINNRVQDYLREIGQTDKALSAECIDHIGKLSWDYKEIAHRIDVRRKASVAFLEEALDAKKD